jgi:hypothetical protein
MFKTTIFLLGFYISDFKFSWWSVVGVDLAFGNMHSVGVACVADVLEVQNAPVVRDKVAVLHCWQTNICMLERDSELLKPKRNRM